MSELTYALIPPGQLERVWPLCSPWLLKAVGPDAKEASLQQFREDCTRGVSQLWAVHCQERGVLAAALTETSLILGKRVLVIRLMGGKEMDRWIDALAVIERWAMVNGFELVETWGRPAWQAVLKDYGYNHAFSVMRKNVSKELH